VRCPISTRKSTEEGLEQAFNSLDAQREAAQAYVLSQQHEGWSCLPDRYDDGGCSGGNMDRPALRRLMAESATGQVYAGATAAVHLPVALASHGVTLLALAPGHRPAGRGLTAGGAGRRAFWVRPSPRSVYRASKVSLTQGPPARH
jgi:Resolvase, N terminal domain